MPFAYDPTGTSPSNYVQNEFKELLTFASELDPYILLPDNAPFYKDNFTMISDSGMSLIEGQDFHFGHIWQNGINATGKQLFGSIILTNGTYSGSYYLNYQALGGNYPKDTGAGIIAEGLQTGTKYSLLQLLLKDWNTSGDGQEPIIPAPHLHPLAGMKGISRLVEQLVKITSATANPNNLIKMDDIVDLEEGFIKPVLDKLNSIISLMSGGVLDETPFDPINEKLSKLLPYTEVDPEWEFVEIPLAEFFKVKIGTLRYTLENIPTEINFPQPYVNKCIYADVKVFIANTEAPFQETVMYGQPTISGIPNLILPAILETDTVERTLQYIVIGF